MTEQDIIQLFKENANGKVETNDSSIIQVMDEERFVSVLQQLFDPYKKLNESERDTIHDILYDLDMISSDDWKAVEKYFRMLPEEINSEGVRWGYDDSVVRDNIYVWFKNNK